MYCINYCDFSCHIIWRSTSKKTFKILLKCEYSTKSFNFEDLFFCLFPLENNDKNCCTNYCELTALQISKKIVTFAFQWYIGLRFLIKSMSSQFGPWYLSEAGFQFIWMIAAYIVLPGSDTVCRMFNSGKHILHVSAACICCVHFVWRCHPCSIIYTRACCTLSPAQEKV